jgi:hypothetical protein
MHHSKKAGHFPQKPPSHNIAFSLTKLQTVIFHMAYLLIIIASYLCSVGGRTPRVKGGMSAEVHFHLQIVVDS